VRVKISITLPADLIERLDQVDTNRSALLEQAALAFLAQDERLAQEALRRVYQGNRVKELDAALDIGEL
jgi:metal-responsive CopG/Arc/MetJ family transcriptional regulator